MISTSHSFSFTWTNPPDGSWYTLFNIPNIYLTFEEKLDPTTNIWYILGEIKFKKTKTLIEVKKLLVRCYVEQAKKL